MTKPRQIKEIAESQFPNYLESLHENYPELILKYQINTDMKNEFFEAVLAQYWKQKPFNMNTVLESIVKRKFK